MHDKKLSLINRGWLTGLFEGEGCIHIYSKNSVKGVRVALSMTDLDVIERAYKICGVGSIHSRKVNGCKRAYIWLVHATEEAHWLVTQMLPLFGERRSAKAREALQVLDQRIREGRIGRSGPRRKRQSEVCAQGHSLTPGNTRERKGRSLNARSYLTCLTCERQQNRQRRLAKKVS